MHVHKRCTWLLILQYWWTSFQHFKVPEFRKILPPSEQNRIIKSPSPHTKFWMNISRDLIQFLDLFWISSLLNDIKYQLCYLKWCLCTQKFYLFIVTSIFLIIISCSFSVFFENNHKCVPFGLFITKIINLLLLLIFFIISLFFRFILNIKWILNDIKYQLCYLKRGLCTQKFYLFIVASFFLL